MDLTQGTPNEKNNRAKKMMLWFGIISLIMSFAGWTSAFVVSRSRPDWLHNFKLPEAFTTSTILLLLSSLTLFIASRALRKNNKNSTSIFLILTFLLGVLFVVYQFKGFQEIINQGYYFTGASSNVTMSYIYVIAIMHIVHVLVGLICLLVVIYNHFKQKYTANNRLGFDLASTFWYFVDLLWLYLFLFLYFMM